MQQLHELRYWFTNIKEVEREISLRTEAGLYYSYYKNAVPADKSLNDVFNELIHDTRFSLYISSKIIWQSPSHEFHGNKQKSAKSEIISLLFYKILFPQ